MIASFSFPSTAHVTQWSNYLTQRAKILTPRSNLTPQRAKNTVKDLSVVTLWCLCYRSRFRQVGSTVPLFFSRDQQAAIGNLLRMDVILANTSLLPNTLRKKK